MKNNTIFIFKCVGILLIVFEHITTYQNINYFDNPFVCVIKSFTMPAFMIMSGFIIAKKTINDKWLEKKALKFGLITVIGVIVYWLWWQLYPNLSMLKTELNLIDFFGYSFASGFNTTGIWYIYTILLCYIILFLSTMLRNSTNWNLTYILIGIMVVLNVIPYYLLGMGFLKWYGLYMIAGYIIGLQQEKLKRYLWTTYAGMFLFAIFIIWTKGMTAWQDLEYGRGGYTFILVDILNGKCALLGVMFASSILGTLALVGVCRLLNKIPYLNTLLVTIGTCSLWIYLIHPLFVGIHQNVAISFILCTMFSVAICASWRYVNQKRSNNHALNVIYPR